MAAGVDTPMPGVGSTVEELALRLRLIPGEDSPGDVYLAHWRTLLESSAEAQPRLCLSSFGQLATLRDECAAFHVFVWRDPADHWWSSRSSTLGDAVNRILLNFPPGSPAIDLLHDALGLHRFAGSSLADALDFYALSPLDADDSFMLFYLLWCLALREAQQSADLVINLNALSSSAPYREEVTAQLDAAGYRGTDFSMCAAPRGTYSPAERAWMHDLEHRVHGWLLASGWSSGDLTQLSRLREEFADHASAASALVPPVAGDQTGRVAELADYLSSAEHPEQLRIEAALRRLESSLQAQRQSSGLWENTPDDLAAPAPVADADIGVELEQARTEANRYAQELAAMRRSFSWRITLPLRVGLEFLAHPVQFGHRAIQRLLSLLLAGVAALLGRAQQFLLARPTLAARVARVFTRFPRLRMLAYKSMTVGRSPEPAVTHAGQPTPLGINGTVTGSALEAGLARSRSRVGEEYRSPLERAFS